jgi:hypothetical protein
MDVTGKLTVHITVNKSPQDSPAEGEVKTYPRIILEGVHVGVLEDHEGLLDSLSYGESVVLVLDGFVSEALARRDNKIFNLFSALRLFRKEKRLADFWWRYFTFPLKSLIQACWYLPKLCVIVVWKQLTGSDEAESRRQFLAAYWKGLLHWVMLPINLLLQRGDRLLYYRLWLDRQYSNPKRPYLDEFCPGVYDTLAKQLRENGYEEDAKAVLEEKFRIRWKVSAIWYTRPFWWMFDVFFSHGFSSARALCTMLVCIAVGSVSVRYANSDAWPWHHEPVLVVTTSTVNTLAITRSENGKEHVESIALAKPNTGQQAAPIGEVPCGPRIDPVWYATQLFIPALDLHETSVCEVSSEPRAFWWRFWRVFYTVLGWIVTAITVLTIPGYLRRQAES